MATILAGFQCLIEKKKLFINKDAMLNKFPAIEGVIEPVLAILGASTTKILFDLWQKKTVTVWSVLFQYIGGTLAGYLTYKYYGATNLGLVWTCTSTLFVGDIIKYCFSKEGQTKIKSKLGELFNIILT